jgi:glycine dehydrogenase
VLLAVISGMYAVYHGPKGLRAIAERVGRLAGTLAVGLEKVGLRVKHRRFFDTVRVDGNVSDVASWLKAAAQRRINLRRLSETAVSIALDETTTEADVQALWRIFGADGSVGGGLLLTERPRAPVNMEGVSKGFDAPWAGSERTGAYLTHPVFNTHHSRARCCATCAGWRRRICRSRIR